jgi:hypothetical protein
MPTGSLPESGKKLWEEVYDKAKKGSCEGDEECAARTAWSAVKGAGWSKDKEGKWHKKSAFEEQFLTIKKAYTDPKTGEKRWRADTSNTSNDLAGDNMTLELFADFVGRINADELAPEEYRSDFWEGGMPYLSISHYTDLDGEAVPGVVDAVYVDGSYLKAKGRMHDNQLGNACWKSLCEDLERVKKGETGDNKVRVSIGFLDFGHTHKSTGFVFDRKSLDDVCPECFKELIEQALEGKEPLGKSFYKGLLVHLAMTRVPMNRDTTIDPDMEVIRSMTTRKEDAASIIGEELAEELDDKAKLVGKSEVLVIKSEDEPLVEEAKTDKKDEEMEDEEDEDSEEYKDKKKKKEMKSEAVDFSAVLSAIAELKSAITPATQPVHALDEAFAQFKTRYDEVCLSNNGADEKLRLIQPHFEELGSHLVSAIKSTVQTEEVVVKSDNTGIDMVKALSEALQPLAQRLDLLIQQNKPVTNPVSTPERRSFNPISVQQANLTMQAKPLSIDEIARRSVGL